MEFLTVFSMLFSLIAPIISIFILLSNRTSNYSKIDNTGRRYHTLLMTYTGRKCPRCDLRVSSRIPSCLYCGHDFPKDHEDTLI